VTVRNIDLSNLRNQFDKDYLLGLMGLETKSSFVDYLLPTIGIFSLGVLVGASVGMILTPRTGRELRDTIRNRFSGTESDVVSGYTGGVGERGGENIGGV
jgi:hypothetical protein